MADHSPSPHATPPPIHRAEIDTTRPFRSVREAVAIFGERILVAQKPSIVVVSSSPINVVASASTSVSTPSSLSSLSHLKRINEHHEHVLASTLQKLEAELEETKRELKLLKERESETEIALASLNAELHKNMSKMAQAEADAAARAAVKSSVEEKKRKEGGKLQFDHSPTLGQVLKQGETEEHFEMAQQQRKLMKKKPIIPLLGDMFSRKKKKKKESSASLYNPLYVQTPLKQAYVS